MASTAKDQWKFIGFDLLEKYINTNEKSFNPYDTGYHGTGIFYYESTSRKKSFSIHKCSCGSEGVEAPYKWLHNCPKCGGRLIRVSDGESLSNRAPSIREVSKGCWSLGVLSLSVSVDSLAKEFKLSESEMECFEYEPANYISVAAPGKLTVSSNLMALASAGTSSWYGGNSHVTRQYLFPLSLCLEEKFPGDPMMYAISKFNTYTKQHPDNWLHIKRVFEFHEDVFKTTDDIDKHGFIFAVCALEAGMTSSPYKFLRATSLEDLYKAASLSPTFDDFYSLDDLNEPTASYRHFNDFVSQHRYIASSKIPCKDHILELIKRGAVTVWDAAKEVNYYEKLLKDGQKDEAALFAEYLRANLNVSATKFSSFDEKVKELVKRGYVPTAENLRDKSFYRIVNAGAIKKPMSEELWNSFDISPLEALRLMY